MGAPWLYNNWFEDYISNEIFLCVGYVLFPNIDSTGKYEFFTVAGISLLSDFSMPALF